MVRHLWVNDTASWGEKEGYGCHKEREGAREH